MSDQRNTKRLAKRFLVTFALVAAVVGVASFISGGSDSEGSEGASTVSSGPSQTIASTDPVRVTAAASDESVSIVASTIPVTTASLPVSPDLPTPDLTAFCAKTAQPGATVGAVDATFNFSCVSASGVNSGPIPVDVVCADEFGAHSRQVTLLKAPQELRCVPSKSVLVGTPDFDAYCRLTYGRMARASRIAIDRKGWRCVGLPNGVFEIFDVDFDGHETDRVCQVSTDVETYAADDSGITDQNAPWECYAGP